MALTDKQKKFVTEYLVDLNATQAAIRAGYSKRSARQIGDQNLSKHDVKTAISERQKKREEKTGITAEWALRRLLIEAELTGEGSSHSARVSALNLAMKHLGMLKEDAPHPDRAIVDLKALTDDALDRILAATAPLLSPELRALCAPAEDEPAKPA